MRLIKLFFLLILMPCTIWGQGADKKTIPHKGNDAEHFILKTKGMNLKQTKKVLQKTYHQQAVMFQSSREFLESSKCHYDNIKNKEQVTAIDTFFWQLPSARTLNNIDKDLRTFTAGAGLLQEWDSNNHVWILDIESDNPTKYTSDMEYFIDTIYYVDGTKKGFETDEIYRLLYRQSQESNVAIDSILARPAHRTVVETNWQLHKLKVGQVYRLAATEITVLELEDNYIQFLQRKISNNKDIEEDIRFANAEGKPASMMPVRIENLQMTGSSQNIDLDSIRLAYGKLLQALDSVDTKEEGDQLIQRYISPYVIYNDGDSLAYNIKCTVSTNIDQMCVRTTRYQTVQNLPAQMLRNRYASSPRLVLSPYCEYKEIITYEDYNFEGDYDETVDEPADSIQYIQNYTELREGFFDLDWNLKIANIEDYELKVINSNYYRGRYLVDKYAYFYLDADKLALVPLDVDKISLVNRTNSQKLSDIAYNRRMIDSVVIVEKDSKFALWGSKGKPLTNYYDTLCYDVEQDVFVAQNNNDSRSYQIDPFTGRVLLNK